MDESNFVNIKEVKIWVIGVRNNKTGNIRVDLYKTRNENDMKNFINNHIKINNNIVTDGWASYDFLDSQIVFILMKDSFTALMEILVLFTIARVK